MASALRRAAPYHAITGPAMQPITETTPQSIRYRATRLVHLWGRDATVMAERYVTVAQKAGSTASLSLHRSVLREVRHLLAA